MNTVVGSTCGVQPQQLLHSNGFLLFCYPIHQNGLTTMLASDVALLHSTRLISSSRPMRTGSTPSHIRPVGVRWTEILDASLWDSDETCSLPTRSYHSPPYRPPRPLFLPMSSSCLLRFYPETQRFNFGFLAHSYSSHLGRHTHPVLTHIEDKYSRLSLDILPHFSASVSQLQQYTLVQKTTS